MDLASTPPRWDISGKTVLITGATSGIGQAGAIELARRGALLAVLGRNPAKLEALVADVDERADGAAITTFVADLSDLDRVREVTGEILEALPRIDVLINNAGIAASSAKTGPSGFDEMMAGNYLGPFLLTHLLLPRLQESAPARLIFTASEAHRLTGGFDPQGFERLGDYHGLGAQFAYGTPSCSTSSPLTSSPGESTRPSCPSPASVPARCTPGSSETSPLQRRRGTCSPARRSSAPRNKALAS